MIHITSDSTTDLGELYERRGIEKLPLAVVLGSDTYEDGVTIHPSDIYDFVEKNKILPKTAARSVEEHREFFASILNSDDDSIVQRLQKRLRRRFAIAFLGRRSAHPLRVRSSRRGQIHRERNLRKVSRPRSRRRSVFLRGYDGLPV